ncbi:MAG: pyruvate, water dikinase [Parcubacteria group bacterium Gr01-1014_31]|nr:MAG: pyruvate, water dikinase [Parcubacteria group bacterium Gr01-1014_31]
MSMAKQAAWSIIAKEYVASLFPAFMLPDGWARLSKLGILQHPVSIAVAIHGEDLTWFCQPKNWEIAHRRLVAKIQLYPRFLAQNFRTCEERGKKLIAYAKTLSPSFLRTLTAAQLNRCYQRYVVMNTTLYGLSAVIPLLDFQTTTFITDEINRILQGHNAAAHTTLLTTPRRATYNKRAEIALLHILATIRRQSRLVQQFKTLPPDRLVTIISGNYPTVWRKIRSHAQTFAWVNYVYQGPAAGPAYFVSALKDLVDQGISPEAQLRQYEQERKTLALRQHAVVKKLQLDRNERAILELARASVFFKPYRRELQTWSYYLLEPLLAEMARRAGLTIPEIRMLLPSEVEILLRYGGVDRSEIRNRLRCVVYGRQGKRQWLLVGKPAADFLQANAEKNAVVEVNEIHGTTACTGKVRGTVKLISAPSEMGKMKRGDILVSRATSPNLMPAIRQASAIVTDEGGLTCHAAIVSRELLIPCVVGTKIATSVFRDGDRVEVDAERGVVRKV